MTTARKWGLITINPVIDTTAPTVVDKQLVVLDADQTKRLLDSSANDRLGALWSLACFTGMRQGELLGVTWADLDLHNGAVSVRKTLKRINGQFVQDEPKTPQSRRTLPLAPDTIEALRRHRRRQREERLAAGAGWDDESLVFVTSTQKPFHGAEALKALHVALRRAGLPQVRMRTSAMAPRRS